MVREILASAGHDVHLAPDGASALAAIQAREPELMVLDLVMPGMSGIEVCRAVKLNPFTARIPVLMLTARGDVEHKVEAFEAGADDYLAKPFDPRELRARIVALLRLVRREGDRNPTSGLPGGQAIEDEIARRAKLRERFAICYIDLDNFKPFADTFGFTIADVVIRDMGHAIRWPSATRWRRSTPPTSSPPDDGRALTRAARATSGAKCPTGRSPARPPHRASRFDGTARRAPPKSTATRRRATRGRPTTP